MNSLCISVQVCSNNYTQNYSIQEFHIFSFTYLQIHLVAIFCISRKFKVYFNTNGQY